MKGIDEAAATTDTAIDTEKLRAQAKEILMQSTSSGKLDEALTKLKESKGSGDSGDAGAPKTEALRKEAKINLLAALDNGQLDEALTNLKVKKDGDEAPAESAP